MFTKQCYIKKNTKELRDKLKALGYKLNHGKTWGKYLVCFKINGTEECRFVATPEYDLKNMPDFKNAIDCGTNEELFLAIAALRDDSDYMQWFVSKGWKDGFGNVEDKWVLCDQDTLEYFGAVNNSPNTYNRKKYPEFGWHKATVKELIEHFKNKEN